MTKVNNEMRELTDLELDTVTGAAAPIPQVGYGPARLNISPFGMNSPLDAKWDIVGATGHL